VLGNQFLPHDCLIQRKPQSKHHKLTLVFQVHERASQELQEVTLDFDKKRVGQRVIVPGLIGSVSMLTRDKKKFQVAILEGKQDKIVSYDLKRHTYT
jgi:hypothetical protein